MKVMIEVNNYQYGMPQIKNIVRQFAYKEELIQSKWHHIYLEFQPSELNLKWLERLVNYKIEEIKD